MRGRRSLFIFDHDLVEGRCLVCDRPIVFRPVSLALTRFELIIDVVFVLSLPWILHLLLQVVFLLVLRDKTIFGLLSELSQILD